MNTLDTLPSFTLSHAGHVIAPQLHASLSKLVVEQSLSNAARCTLVFESPGDLAQKLTIDDRIEIALFDGKSMLFDGQIVSVAREYNPGGDLTVFVEARDGLDALHNKQNQRVFEKVSTGDLIKEICTEHGLSVKGKINGPNWQRLIQCQRSDFDMLLEVTSGVGLYFTLQGKSLEVMTLEGTGSALDLEFGSRLFELGFEENSARSVSSVRVTGWDPWRALPVSAKASNARCTRQSKPGKRVTNDRICTNGAWQSKDQAEAFAQAMLDVSVNNEITAYGVANGHPEIRPGVVVNLVGTNDPYGGRFVLTKVTHTLDATHGFVSRFDTSVPQLPKRTEAGSVTMGKVKRVDDPAKLGRVKVDLACFDGLESDWLEVLLPGAGPNKGFVALPAKGDNVLVSLLETDPAQGVVLGGMFGDSKPGFSLRTPGGQTISLEDKKNIIRMNHENGSYFEMTDKKMKIHSTGDLTIEAPGQPLVIKAKTIDFEQS